MSTKASSATVECQWTLPRVGRSAANGADSIAASEPLSSTEGLRLKAQPKRCLPELELIFEKDLHQVGGEIVITCVACDRDLTVQCAVSAVSLRAVEYSAEYIALCPLRSAAAQTSKGSSPM